MATRKRVKKAVTNATDTGVTANIAGYAPAHTPVDPYAVRGTPGLKQYSGYVRDEWLTQLSGDKGVKVYSEMRDNDAIVGAYLYAIEQLCKQVDYRIEPASKTDADALRWARFAEECMLDLETSWSDLLSSILSMLPFGWSAFELVAKKRGGLETDDPKFHSRYNDGLIGWRDIAHRAQETLLHWTFDETGTTTGLVQVPLWNFPIIQNQVFIPRDKLALFRTTGRKNNPEGRSILRNAYRSWFFLKRLQEIEAVGLERSTAGMPVLEMPPAFFDPNASSEMSAVVTEMQTLMQEIKQDERMGIVIPAEKIDGKETGWKLRSFGPDGKGSVAFGPHVAIERYEKRMATSVLADFLMLGQGPNGSYSLAESKTSLFAVALGALLDNICETFSRECIGGLMKWNGVPPQYWPVLAHGDIERPDLAAFVSAVTSLTQAGVLTPGRDIEQRVRDVADLPALADGGPGDAIG